MPDHKDQQDGSSVPKLSSLATEMIDDTYVYNTPYVNPLGHTQFPGTNW